MDKMRTPTQELFCKLHLVSPNGISDFGITCYVPNNNHVYATTTSVEKM